MLKPLLESYKPRNLIVIHSVFKKLKDKKKSKFIYLLTNNVCGTKSMHFTEDNFFKKCVDIVNFKAL